MPRITSVHRVRRQTATALAITGVALGSLGLIAPAQAVPAPSATSPAQAVPAVTGDQQLTQLMARAQELQTTVNARRTQLLQAQAQLAQARAQLADVQEAEALATEAEANARREADEQARVAAEAKDRAENARAELGRSATRTYINGQTSEMATMMAMIDAQDGNDVAQAMAGQRIVTERRARTLTGLIGAERTQQAASVQSAAAAEQARVAAADAAGLRARTEQQVAQAEAAVAAAQSAVDTAERDAAANGVAVSNRQAALDGARQAGGPTGAPAPVPSGSTQEQVMQQAQALTGIPYRWGGTTPAGFDCSGYSSYVMRQVGVQIPRTAAQQQAFATPVSDPQPGDLVFFGKPAYHVGIYAGNGMMYHSPRTGKSTELARVYSSSAGYGRVLR